MAEVYPKSKLKRKKPSVGQLHPEVSSRVAVERGQPTLLSGDGAADAGSVAPAAAWWSREQLPAVERLWASTLKSALPHLESQRWDLVPDLPHPSTVRAAALTLDEQRRCDLRGDVAPFPEPAPPSPGAAWSPDPLRLGSPQQDLSVRTKPVPHTSGRPLSSRSRQGPDGKAASLQALTKRQWPPLHSWEEAASSAGCSSVGGGEGRTAGEQEQEAGPVHRQLLTNQEKVSDSRVSLQKQVENKEDVMTDEEEEAVRGGIGGDGAAAGGLQSCPMCLLVFPVGFTQMDCDSHLAQCLSEMNVDLTW